MGVGLGDVVGSETVRQAGIQSSLHKEMISKSRTRALRFDRVEAAGSDGETVSEGVLADKVPCG
jgi:hypothetical protein